MGGDRILPEKIKSQGEYYLYLKEVFTYDWCRRFLSKNSCCLDVGCGEGYGSKMLSPFVSKIIGIDINKKIIKRAYEKYGSKKCVFKSYNGKRLPFLKETFDVVISFQVIEHIIDDIAFISEIYRVLKQKGIFILTTPNKLIRLPGKIKPWNIFHVREYNYEDLNKIFKPVFREVRVYGVFACDKIKKIEDKRIKENLKIISYDFLNLRRVIPLFILVFVVKFINYIKSFRREDNIGLEKIEDISLLYEIKDGVQKESLDILAIGKK